MKEKQRDIRERSRSRSRQRNTTSYAQAVTSSQGKTEGSSGITREDHVKIVSSITYAHMVEGILPRTFKHTVQEMYRLNGLPEVRFPDYVPSPSIDKDKIQLEIDKMLRAFKEAQGEETKQPEEEEMEELPTRKRIITPPPQEQRQTKSRKEEEIETDDEEAAIALKPIYHGSTHSLQSDFIPQPKTVPPKVVDKKPTDSRLAAKETKSYDKHVSQMKFCFIKLKETIVRKKEDIREISQLLKEGRIKYVYSNPDYSEGDCRAVWERGYVNLQNIDIKTVTKEMYMDVEYNGKFLERRSSMTGTIKKK